MKTLLWIGCGLALVIIGAVLIKYLASTKPTQSPQAATPTHQPAASLPDQHPAAQPPPSNPPPVAPTPAIVAPVADFKARITKKFFGTYVTPQNSPVQPERFTGYHTGVDVEYGDRTDDVPVVAVVDAQVTMAQWMSGYGGLLVLRGSISGHEDYLLYGHLRPSSLPAVGSAVKQGDQVGLLGTAFSHDTDGERRHLHFAIYARDPADIRGYVQSQSELSAWQNPLDVYR